jgi:hypothetical protein
MANDEPFEVEAVREVSVKEFHASLVGQLAPPIRFLRPRDAAGARGHRGRARQGTLFHPPQPDTVERLRAWLLALRQQH